MAFQRTKLSRAVSNAIRTSTTLTTALALVPTTSALAQSSTTPASEPGRRAIEEVVVTATRRSENMQDVPISIHAFDQQTIRDLRIGKFEDYVGATPGVSLGGQGPGRNEVFIRGVSAGRGGVRIAGIGQEPNVAIYIDDAPITTPGRNVDVYTTDLQRIEVLKGPQGTQFGASSQTGTIRLITNKPVLNEFQFGGQFGLTTVNDGETGNATEGYVNLPVIDDRLALRFAGYDVKKGGYIDNISGTKKFPLENPTMAARLAAGNPPPERRTEITNLNVAEDDFNTEELRGLRSSVYYEHDENWNFHAQFLHQQQDTEGIWEVQPELRSPGGAQFSTQTIPPGEVGEFTTQTFSVDSGDDKLNHGTWTLNGRIDTGRLAGLDLVYTGSYMDREFEGTQDYTGYANTGPFIPYYVCNFPEYTECFSPQLFVEQFFGVERQHHEFRITTPQQYSLRMLAGVFYEDTQTIERGNWTYPGSIPAGFVPNLPVEGATSSDPTQRPAGVTFFNDFIRDREEISGFTEISYDIVDDLTATFGLRRYSIDIALRGNSSFGARANPAASGVNVDAVLEGQSPTTLDDIIFKGNLTWRATNEALFYVTFSEGFRSGGFNRNGTGTGPNDIPFFFESDDVQNHEFGWKTRFLGGAMQFNGAAYFIEFEQIQTQVLDFTISNISFLDNVGDAEIFGAEFNFDWHVTDRLSSFLSFSYNDTELTEVPESVVNLAPEGSELALAPEVQINWRGRYEQPMLDNLLGFVQLNVNYTDDSFSDILTEKRFVLSSYTLVDLSFGVSGDRWRAEAFVDNLNDKFAPLFKTNEDELLRTRPTAPRTFGVKLSYDY